MRKAISRKASRRKQASDVAANKGNISLVSNFQNDATNDQNQKRTPTEGEAVLTAKNYRLAKELSELRVRHREESKNVTRLTMENMNLASRCREAISHVAMLKKELAMHQRRATEALALQRQQHSQKVKADSTTGGNFGESIEHMKVEMERMDKLMEAHVLPAVPPTSKVIEKEISPKSLDSNGSPTSEFFTDNKDGKKPLSSYLASSHVSSGVSSVPDAAFTPNAISREPPSPSASSRKKDYNEGFPNDLPLSSKMKLSKLNRNTPPEIMENEHDTNSSEAFGLNTNIEKRDGIMSSIDAFEASFATTFPLHLESASNNQSSSEIYNPFFPSPSRKKVERGGKGSLEKAENSFINQDYSFPNENSMPSDLEKKNTISEVTNKFPQKAEHNEAIQHLHRKSSSTSYVSEWNLKSSKLFSASLKNQVSSSNFQPSLTNHLESTLSQSTSNESSHDGSPPSAYKRQDQNDPQTPNARTSRNNENNLEHPRRPEKTISSVARARYEKALQPRNNQSNRSITINSTQRKKDDQLENNKVNIDKEMSSLQENNMHQFIENKQTENLHRKLSNNSDEIKTNSLKKIRQKTRNEVDFVKDTSVQSDNTYKRRNSNFKTTSSSMPSISSPFSKTKPVITNSNSFSPTSKNNTEENPIESETVASPSVSSAVSAYEKVVARTRGEDKLSRSKLSHITAVGTNSFLEEDKRKKEEKGIVATGVRNFQLQSSPPDSSEKNSHSETFSEREGANFSTNFQTIGRGTRRNIKQPISYAEPSVHTKLRRGDIFFAKEEPNDESNNTEIRKDFVSSIVRL